MPKTRGARTAVPLRSDVRHVGPHRVHAFFADERDGLPLVFVHGWGVSGRYLLPAAARVALHHPVWVPDLPGHGRSSDPAEVLDVRGQADALLAWLDAVGIRHAVLVGNSMGGQVASVVAARRPERVPALVLVGPTVDASARTLARQAARFCRAAFAEKASLVPLLLRDYARTGPRRLWRELQFALEDRIEERLPRVHSPAMVVRGERDRLVPAAWAAEVARLLPNGRLVEIPRGGHALQYSLPDPFVAYLRGFLRDVLPPNGR